MVLKFQQPCCRHCNCDHWQTSGRRTKQNYISEVWGSGCALVAAPQYWEIGFISSSFSFRVVRASGPSCVGWRHPERWAFWAQSTAPTRGPISKIADCETRGFKIILTKQFGLGVTILCTSIWVLSVLGMPLSCFYAQARGL